MATPSRSGCNTPRDVVEVTQGTLYPALHGLENRKFLRPNGG